MSIGIGMPRKAPQEGASLHRGLAGYPPYSREALAQFRHQEPRPGILRRKNNDSDKNKEQALQEGQKPSGDAQEDETPPGDEDQDSLTTRLHANKFL
jgi:hypothetical protein